MSDSGVLQEKGEGLGEEKESSSDLLLANLGTSIRGSVGKVKRITETVLTKSVFHTVSNTGCHSFLKDKHLKLETAMISASASWEQSATPGTDIASLEER
jgi:hypothetical protein